MSSAESVTSIDFTAPRRLPGTASRALSSWNATATTMLQEYWQGLAGPRVTLQPARIDSSVAQKAQQGLPDPGYAALLKIGEEKFNAMAAFSNRLVLTLVSEMLGTLGDTWPDPRPLTAAELSLVELLFGEIARALSQGWPEVTPLSVELDDVIVRPLRSRIFQPRENLIRIAANVTTAVGEESFTMLMPQTGLATIGIQETVVSAVSDQTASPQMRALAESLPVTMSVSLGKATLTLGEMNRLSVGDMLVLDQSVAGPLEARISGRLQWLGSPCRMGPRQGFRIVATRKD
ncbi:MAG: FliM/FliN family flagellar motor switch protein [Planctomycetota bacterium]